MGYDSIVDRIGNGNIEIVSFLAGSQRFIQTYCSRVPSVSLHKNNICAQLFPDLFKLKYELRRYAPPSIVFQNCKVIDIYLLTFLFELVQY